MRGFLARQESAIERFAERMKCVPRILEARNARMGRPLNDHDLADLAQDTLIVILRKIDQFVEGSSLEGWVYKICCFELMNHVRRKRKQPLLLDDFSSVDSSGRSGNNESPWEYEDLYRGLEVLEAEEAAVIRLKFFEGFTFRQIGQVLDISAGTAKTRHYRGLVKLQQFLANRSGGAP